MKVIIDGKEIETQEERTILEIAQENGISIPSLCDHPQLVPFTGCRLCLVQIKGQKGFLPACSTIFKEGMEVKTQTPRLQRLRKQILELILTEHPNACLICREKENCDELKSTIRKVGETTGCVLCPNNGRCELQDVVQQLKLRKVNFASYYREIEMHRKDPFFDRNYNLCILCGRCVRICHEIRGLSTLTFIQRGPDTVVGTALDRSLMDSNCQFCGACVDVCPTGALTEKAVKYENLPDEISQAVCPLCSLGCNLEVRMRDGQILNFIPATDGLVNKGQACVKGRFTLKDVVYSPRRIGKPMVRQNKELEEVSWEEALDYTAQRLRKYKRQEIAMVGSSQASCEDIFVFNRFADEVIKAKRVCRALNLSPLSAYNDLLSENGQKSGLNYKISGISKAKVIILLGANIAVTHPIIWLKVLEAVRNGTRLIVVSSVEFLFNRFASQEIKLKPGTEGHFIHALSKIIFKSKQSQDLTNLEGFAKFKKQMEKITLAELADILNVKQDTLRKTAGMILGNRPHIFLFGPEFVSRSESTENLAALWNLAVQTEGQLIPLSPENNSRGLFELSPDSLDVDISAEQIIDAVNQKQIRALYLAGPFNLPKRVKPEFMVIQDSFMSESVNKADVVLPTTTFAEADGVFVNTEGRVQKSERIIEPLDNAKPDWWIYSQLAKRMGSNSFGYQESKDIWKEIQKNNSGFAKIAPSKLRSQKEAFIHEPAKRKAKLVAMTSKAWVENDRKKYPMLMTFDCNLDQYKSLVLSEENTNFRVFRDSRWIMINHEDAAQLNLNDGDRVEIEFPASKIQAIARISNRVVRGQAVAAFAHTVLGVNPIPNSLPVKIKRGK